MPSLQLTSYNMGDATESDYDSFVEFVAERIDKRCGFEVDVDASRFGEAGDNVVSSATDEQRETIREALRVLWDDWCAAGVVLSPAKSS